MAVLGLRCCAGAFSSCSKWATLCCSTQASLCDGLSYCGAWALGLLALVAAAPPLSHRMFWPIECFLLMVTPVSADTSISASFQACFAHGALIAG